MGIKGIYRELGPGKRISLSKLASDSFEEHNRPLRLAIDIAIWQFQNQVARGGTNPAIRTLFYRLVRLLGTPIQPIFVFDGPNKPKIKRNKRSGRGDGFTVIHAKRLIRYFGFVVHDAPGEAEAECAFLQKNGVVDAVLSEDVDTIMFGCTRTLRNWSAEGKGSTPTHVSMYDVKDLKMADLGLDREGMVLVALMSGGDYIPEGVPGCGPKVACEAAKAGYGKSLCRLRASDAEGLRRWKASLTHELHTNESKHFRTRHKALAIPADFPNAEVLQYYTHPLVSPDSVLEDIRQKLEGTGEIQLPALREFVKETFNWDFRVGAVKLIRVLSEGLFVNRLHQDGVDGDSLVKRVSGRRSHSSTDGTSELRLAYIPGDIVPIDISNEPEEEIAYARSGLALNSDDEFAAVSGSVDPVEDAPKVFDITKPTLTWVLEEVARRFAPKAIQAWEEGSQAKSKRKSPTKKKASASRAKKADAMPHGALDKFVRVTKAMEPPEGAKGSDAGGIDEHADVSDGLSEPEDASLPPLPPLSPLPPLPLPSRLRRPQTPPSLREPSKQPTPSASPNMGSWTIAGSPDSTRRHDDAGVFEAIVISSSPAGDASPLLRPRPSSPITISPASSSEELPRSIRSILAASAASRVRSETGRLASSVSKPKQRRPALSQASQGAAKIKQMSIDVFTQKHAQSEMNRPAPSKRSEVGTYKPSSSREDVAMTSTNNEGGLFPSSAPNSPPTSRPKERNKRARFLIIPPPLPQRDSSPSPVPTKKVFVPSTSRPSFLDDLEFVMADDEERSKRESQPAQTRGIGSTRWSDASFIDLTNETDATINRHRII
ncbi:flap structure-specific endonuclease [Trichoderma cornu-damae]|uniref:Flap structure-specific endonuclease n=1 Tax=Trichoderma cornu-damae TaxID=654480 RepID=A0A9P8QJQ2_9HYPO|nr:flap structure-specific endonuclease [Trichoderma cornu-damae]